MFKFSIDHKFLSLKKSRIRNTASIIILGTMLLITVLFSRIISKIVLSRENSGFQTRRRGQVIDLEKSWGPLSNDESRAVERNRKKTYSWNKQKIEKRTLFAKGPSYCDHCRHNSITHKSFIKNVVVNYREPSPKP